MQRRPPEIIDYVQIFLRRKWWIILPAVLLASLMAGISVNLPRYYKSSTTIGVDAQKVPTDFVKNTINGDVVQRLQSISQEILSRTRLQKIIDQYGLYKDKTKLSQEDVIELMRKDITLDVVEDKSNTSNQRTLGGFKITFTSTSANLAQQVTRELGSLFIAENLKLREEQAEGTHQFIGQELDKARQDLADQEKKIEQFKTRYMGALPEQQTANLQMIGQAQTMLQANSDALNRAQQQKTYLESMQASLDKQKPAPVKTELQQAITSKRAELSIAQQKYQPNHPDLIRLQKELEALEAQQKQLAATESGGVNPKETQTDQMKSQIMIIDEEIKSRQARQTDLENRIRGLQGKVDILPTIEEQYSELSRDYNAAKENYQTLLLKQNAAGMAADVEHQAQGEQFRVIDPASLPQKPYKPDLIQLNMIGLVLGLAVGGALGYMQEMKDKSMHSDKDIKFYLPVPLLGTMPVVINSESRQQRRAANLRTLMFSGVTILLLIAVSAYLFHNRAAFDIATN